MRRALWKYVHCTLQTAVVHTAAKALQPPTAPAGAPHTHAPTQHTATANHGKAQQQEAQERRRQQGRQIAAQPRDHTIVCAALESRLEAACRGGIDRGHGVAREADCAARLENHVDGYPPAL